MILCTTRQQGITLVEVLIALVLVGFGLLGMFALQIKSQQAEVDVYYRSQALFILEDMVNRMYANSTEAKGSCYDTGNLGSLPGQWVGDAAPYAGCSTASDRDMAAWNETLRGSSELVTVEGTDTPVGAMTGAVGCIEVDATDANLRYVSVAWQGVLDVAVPTNTCGQNLYESELKRRVVTMPVRITDWK